MLWLSWRLFRWQAAAVGVALVVVAIALAITGPHLVHFYDTAVASCRAYGDCLTATNDLTRSDRLLQLSSPLVLMVPALVGIFWGAPLVARELETGTYKLAWTQSATRWQWIAAKVGLLGLASMAVAGIVSLMVTWWSSPIDRVGYSPFAASFFDRRDLVPIGYAAFAFALGVTFGVLIRSTLPAMAATLVAFIGGRLAEYTWIRPHLLTPLTLTAPLNVNPNAGPTALVPGDWTISNTTINGAGQVIGANGGVGSNGILGFSVTNQGTLVLRGVGSCGHVAPAVRSLRGIPAFGQAAQACVDKLGIRQVITYQPLNRYWPFQWMETGLFVIVALALLGFSARFVRRRLLSGRGALATRG